MTIMSDPNELLQSIIDKEKQVKRLKSENPRANLQQIEELQNKIRRGYRTLIVEHYKFLGASPDRDAHGGLWRTFYKVIEEFRKAIKKNTAEFQSALGLAHAKFGAPSAGAGISAAASTEQQQAQRRDIKHLEQRHFYIAQLKQDFLTFLTNAMAFYHKLMMKLEEKVKSERQQSCETSGELLTSLSKCLVYTGDLARYREANTERLAGVQGAQGAVPDFSEASRYYERAALLCPAAGNPHNQLAVLATYEVQDCVAVYRYYRSVLAAEPFAGAFQNLALLFQRNALAFQQLQTASSHSHPGQADSGTCAAGAAGAAGTREFLTRFLRLNAELFWAATRMHAQYAQLLARDFSQPSSASGASASLHEGSGAVERATGSQASMPRHWAPPTDLPQDMPPEKAVKIDSGRECSTGTRARADGREVEDAVVDVEKLQELLASVLRDLDRQVAAGALAEALQVRLLAMCLFCVHYSVARDCNMLAQLRTHDHSHDHSPEAEALTEAGAAPHSIAESLALQLLFGLINRMVSRLAANSTVGSGSKGGGSGSGKQQPQQQRAQRRWRAPMNRLLPALTLFADWAALHEHYLGAAPAPANNSSTTTSGGSSGGSNSQQQQLGGLSEWEGRHLAGVELLRTEARARSGLRAALAGLKPLLEEDLRANPHHLQHPQVSPKPDVEQKKKKQRKGDGDPASGASAAPVARADGSSTAVAGSGRGRLLREHLELRGFLPLAAKIEEYFIGVDPLALAAGATGADAVATAGGDGKAAAASGGAPGNRGTTPSKGSAGALLLPEAPARAQRQASVLRLLARLEECTPAPVPSPLPAAEPAGAVSRAISNAKVPASPPAPLAPPSPPSPPSLPSPPMPPTAQRRGPPAEAPAVIDRLDSLQGRPATDDSPVVGADGGIGGGTAHVVSVVLPAAAGKDDGDVGYEEEYDELGEIVVFRPAFTSSQQSQQSKHLQQQSSPPLPPRPRERSESTCAVEVITALGLDSPSKRPPNTPAPAAAASVDGLRSSSKTHKDGLGMISASTTGFSAVPAGVDGQHMSPSFLTAPSPLAGMLSLPKDSGSRAGAEFGLGGMWEMGPPQPIPAAAPASRARVWEGGRSEAGSHSGGGSSGSQWQFAQPSPDREPALNSVYIDSGDIFFGSAGIGAGIGAGADAGAGPSALRGVGIGMGLGLSTSHSMGSIASAGSNGSHGRGGNDAVFASRLAVVDVDRLTGTDARIGLRPGGEGEGEVEKDRQEVDDMLFSAASPGPADEQSGLGGRWDAAAEQQEQQEQGGHPEQARYCWSSGTNPWATDSAGVNATATGLRLFSASPPLAKVPSTLPQQQQQQEQKAAMAPMPPPGLGRPQSQQDGQSPPTGATSSGVGGGVAVPPPPGLLRYPAPPPAGAQREGGMFSVAGCGGGGGGGVGRSIEELLGNVHPPEQQQVAALSWLQADPSHLQRQHQHQ